MFPLLKIAWYGISVLHRVSIITTLWCHPFRLPSVIIWGLSLYCSVSHRSHTAILTTLTTTSSAAMSVLRALVMNRIALLPGICLVCPEIFVRKTKKPDILSGFFQIISHFPESVNTIRIFPFHFQFSVRFHNLRHICKLFHFALSLLNSEIAITPERVARLTWFFGSMPKIEIYDHLIF